MRKPVLKAIIAIALVVGIGIAIFSNIQKERIQIRIGTNPWPGYEYLHLAEKKGFFDESTYDIQIIRYSSLEDVRRAYEHGQVDGICSTIVEILQANEHGAPSKIALITDYSNGADVVLAHEGINSVAELKGKKVGVEPATLSQFILARALNGANLGLSDVDLVGLNPMNMEESLKSGKVDAVHSYPPISVSILKNIKGSKAIFNSAEIPEEVVGIVSFHPDVIKNNSDALQVIQHGFDLAHKYAETNPDDAYRIMADLEGISPEEFTEALKEIHPMQFGEQRSVLEGDKFLKTIQKVEEVLIQAGEIKNSVDPRIFLIEDKS